MSQVNKRLMRSTERVHMIREETKHDGSIRTIEANLPIGRGWNQGNGVIDWINMGCGWRVYDEYMAEKHKAQVEAKRAAEAHEDGAVAVATLEAEEVPTRRGKKNV
jgi:hypothetical protein